MPVTFIEPQAVEERISQARKQLEEQAAALTEIDHVINSMEEVWESEAQRAYAESFRSSKRKIENFNRFFNKYLQAMQLFARDCASIDGRAGRRLKDVHW